MSLRVAGPAAPAALPAAEPLAKESPCRRFHVELGEARPPSPPPAAAPAPLPAGPLSTSTPEADGARRVVARLLEGERAVERGLERVLAGRTASPRDLLALQVDVIRWSQQLEVASRIVEKATSAVKQTLQTQV